ncbi:MAG: DUF924 domain-containing protein, partial [Pseudomonadota bacterium]|nr:DUF924 domain-containing protein [Pseudomonadota bacterium]
MNDPSPAVSLAPKSILDFWLGELRNISQATEERWRERMLKWRVGIFARGVEDDEFLATQRRIRAEVSVAGDSHQFASGDWDSPHGRLARLIVVDQFTRAAHRGTPLAYASDAAAAALASEMCRRGEDLDALNEIERLWVYVALSHPEDRSLQELSVEKWMQWSSDLVRRCPPELKAINQKVSWFFVKSIIGHAETVLQHGRFPHRNAVLCRHYHAGELYWLTSQSRPVWSYTQPPRPFYYALHTVLHRAAEIQDCHKIDREGLAKLSAALSLPADLALRLCEVFAQAGDETIDFATLFAHIVQPAGEGDLETIESTLRVDHAAREVSRQIFKVEDAVWPPPSGKADVVRRINIAALVAIQQCPYLLGSPSKLSRRALQALACGPSMRSRSIGMAAKVVE